MADKRRKLRNRIIAFCNTASQYLGEDAIDIIYKVEQIVLDGEVSDDDESDLTNPAITSADPERQLLPFPSSVPAAFLTELPPERLNIIVELKLTELHICEGHGDDALEAVRTAVIHLSWEFKNKVRTALTGTEKTKSWSKAKHLTRVWKLQRRVYNHNRTVMMTLGDKKEVGIKYPFLELKDCDVNTTVANHNNPGQSSDRLPWFWSSSARVAATSALDGEHEIECMGVLL